jgi:O-antigen ligase
MSLTSIAFLMAMVAGLGLALFRNPLFGLFTYVAVFYLDPPSRWWGQEIPDLRWSLAAAVVTAIATMAQPVKKDRPPWLTTTPAKILVLFTSWVWIQNLWALSSDDQLSLSILFTKYTVFYYVMYRLIDNQEKMKWFLLLHIAGCLYLGWVAYNTTSGGRLEGVGGPGIDESNALAMQMGTALAVGAMLLLTERGWRWWLCLGAMPFILNTVIMAESRGAFLALFITGATLAYLKPTARAKLFYGFAVLGGVLMIILSNQFFWDRMGTITASADQPEDMDRSAETRILLIKAQFQMAERYPLGAGHRGTAVLSPEYLDWKYMSGAARGREEGQRSSHNTMMTAVVEQGIPGGIMYLWLWGWAGLQLLRFRRHYSGKVPLELAGMTAGIGGALAMIFTAGMFVDYIKTEVQIWMFVLLAIAMQLATKELTDRATDPAQPGAGAQRSPRLSAAVVRTERGPEG